MGLKFIFQMALVLRYAVRDTNTQNTSARSLARRGIKQELVRLVKPQTAKSRLLLCDVTRRPPTQLQLSLAIFACPGRYSWHEPLNVGSLRASS
jgi:hypothetical protein